MLLQLALNGTAPAALVFHQQEDILTLGALVAAHIFDTAIPVFSLNQTDYQALTHAGSARLAGMQSSPTRCRFPLIPFR